MKPLASPVRSGLVADGLTAASLAAANSLPDDLVAPENAGPTTAMTSSSSMLLRAAGGPPSGVPTSSWPAYSRVKGRSPALLANSMASSTPLPSFSPIAALSPEIGPWKAIL